MSKRKKKRARKRSPSNLSAHASTRSRPLASVIIPLLDQLDYTKLCIKSLLEQTPPERLELIVIDNGSGPETAEYLDSLPGAMIATSDTARGGDDAAAGGRGPSITIVRFDENRGIAPAWNAGVREARGRHLVFADNDVLFTDGWLDGILQGFCDETVWAVVPNLSHMFVPRDFGRRAPDMLAQPLMISDESLVGTFFVIPRHVMDRLGPFDEEYGVGPYADLDFEFRLLSAEKRTVEVANVCIHHFEGRTVTQVPGFFDECEERNRAYFDRKWKMPAPLPPMSADFEFQMWLQKVRALPKPDPAEVKRRASYNPSDWPERPATIIACINVFNDMRALPNCLASIEEIDRICFVDGAYAGVKHDVPYSTDGTLEYIQELASRDERITLITCTEAWADEATKRSAYFVGAEGDWYLQLDADEQLITDAFEIGGLDRLRAHLAQCRLDAHFLPIYEPATRMKLVLPRVFRHQEDIRYDAAHWNVVAGDIPIAPDWSAPLPLHGVAVLHNREQRDRQRVQVQDAYYKTMYAGEAEEFERRIADIEARLTGDPDRDAEDLELIWMYRTHVIYQQQYHQAALRGRFGHGS